ncbi:NADH-quinone oxidoreductase subunit N [Paenibacillus selenitireducens]|uniref:NADH-quinone oxidoreductase subunit N n=1 Tax=Paenibacillus selenitireducens TaxID=1324314 RepID=A0A1T2X7Z1_9BACL|nr:NADH-quinone oxidoreductase subunit N [Paenibacillus selenitireducens]OPA75703.1 NADH-quinone oxidoreductase subunit N [Paenibacillus selenitireducens]
MSPISNIQPLQWADLATLAPELTLVIAAILLSLLDLFLPRKINRDVLGVLSLVSVLVSLAFVISKMVSMGASADPAFTAHAIQLLGQSYRVDDFANVFKIIFLSGTALILFMSLGSIREDEIQHKGEYYYLLLPAVLGAMIMASSGDLITLYVGLELLSITSYILVGMKKNDLKSNESAFKYIVLGSISSAFILYGMSFLYGMSGTTNLAGIAQMLSQHLVDFKVLIYVSFFLMFAGFAFKVAAAPFHVWAPDVYQGAPTPVTAFLAVVSKAAGFAILFRIFYNVFFPLGSEEYTYMRGDLTLSVLIVAALAMLIGNTAALRQRNVKRLLALSGVANAGYLLVPIGSFNLSNFSEFGFYLIAYLFMNIGALAVVMIVSRSSGNDEVSSFAGLYYRAPFTAVAMTIFILSFAGIPLTGGFMGKLFIALGAAQAKDYWIIAVMIITSVISLYYYFGIARQMYMRSIGEAFPIRIPAPLGITVWICAIATLFLGVMPNVIVDFINHYFSISFDLFIQMGS